MEILPHNEQISRILYLCKDEDLKEKKIYVDANKKTSSDDQVIYSHIVSRATITSVIYYAYAKVEGRHLLVKENLKLSKQANRYMYDG